MVDSRHLVLAQLLSFAVLGAPLIGQVLNQSGNIIPGTDSITLGPNVDLSERFLPNADLSSQDLSGAQFNSSNLAHSTATHANLSNAVFENAQLHKLDLRNANLSGTDFSNASIYGANFQKATTNGLTAQQIYQTREYRRRQLIAADLSNNDLSGWNFSNQRLTGSNLENTILTGANFRDAVITGASFANTNISSEQILGTKSYQDLHLSRIDLSGSTLDAFNFSGVHMPYAAFSTASLQQANLRHADLTNVNFSNANLSGADFTGANLSGADFSGADLNNVDLSHRRLTNVDFTEAHLNGTELVGIQLTGGTVEANLRGKDLSSATFADTTFSNSDLREVNFANSDLSGTTFTSSDLTGANLTATSWSMVSFSRSQISPSQLMQTSNYLTGKDFRNTDLSYTDLTNIDLSDSQLSGAKLVGANLEGVSMDRANWDGILWLSQATNMPAVMLQQTQGYRNGVLRNIRLDGVDMTGWVFPSVEMQNVDFSYSNLTDARFRTIAFATDVRFIDANLNGAVFEAGDMSGVNLTGADISNTVFETPILPEQIATTKNFTNHELRGVKFRGGGRLPRASHNYAGFDFTGAQLGLNLTSANLTDAILTDVDFHSAIISKTKFGGADLTRAIFSDTTVSANFKGASLDDADFSNAQIWGYEQDALSAEQFESTVNFKQDKIAGITFGGFDMDGWDFSQKDLSGSAFTLRMTNTSFQNANMQGANLRPRHGSVANFQRANLKAATVEISRWNTNVQLDMSSSDLRGASISFPNNELPLEERNSLNLTDADITGATLENLPGPILRQSRNFADRNLRGVKLKGLLYDTDLSDFDLQGVDWRDIEIGSDIVLDNANFSGATLPSISAELFAQTATYRNGDYDGLTFTGLVEHDFSHRNLNGATFTNANLEAANFDNANITNVTFAYDEFAQFYNWKALQETASYRNRDFSGVNFKGIRILTFDDARDFSFTGAEIEGGEIGGTDFRGAIDFEPADSVVFSFSILPDGTVVGPSGGSTGPIFIRDDDVPARFVDELDGFVHLKLGEAGWQSPVVVETWKPNSIYLSLGVADKLVGNHIGKEYQLIDWRVETPTAKSISVGFNAIWDVSELLTTGRATLLGDRRVDVDRNKKLQSTDFNHLCSLVQAGEYEFHADLDRNGIVGQSDLTLMRNLTGATIGDVDLDGTVSFSDFLRLSSNFGETGTWKSGNIDCQGDVDFADFLMLSGNFGVTGNNPLRGAVQIAAVPEPSGAARFLLLPLLWISRANRGGKEPCRA